MQVKETGPNPKLVEMEAVLKLVPLRTENQQVIDISAYSEPDTEASIMSDQVMFTWRNVPEREINYGIKSDIKVKNAPLKMQKEVRYPISSPNQYIQFTEEEKYIDIDYDIQSLADELFKDEVDLFHAAYKVAKWVEENIEYKKTPETEDQVKKSSWVLKNKYGVCDELTNLFASILRSKGIPVKFISGVVYSASNQKFENHGWAEVYFPEHGWLPFDMTYMQYGWIDATHVKLEESEDSGASSIDYLWKSADIEVDLEKLDISGDFKKIGDKMIPILNAVVEPAEAKVGFGSYVPVKITIENPTSFYISPLIFLSKAPQVIGKNKKTLFLKPKETKSTYYTVKIPRELNEDYIFKADIEAEISFGETVSTKLEFSSDYPVITKEEAESIVSEYAAKDIKSQMKTIEFSCTAEKTTYYEDEDVEVICIAKNKEKNQKDLNICVEKDCKGISLSEIEEKVVIFKAKGAERIIASAETKDEIKYSTISLDIIKVPSIVITNIDPLVVNYNEQVDLKIQLESLIPSYNVSIYLEEQEILNTQILHGKKEINVPVKGKDLINGLNLNMIYKDILGKEYIKTEEYLITVKNKPWYVWLFGWVI